MTDITLGSGWVFIQAKVFAVGWVTKALLPLRILRVDLHIIVMRTSEYVQI